MNGGPSASETAHRDTMGTSNLAGCTLARQHAAGRVDPKGPYIEVEVGYGLGSSVLHTEALLFRPGSGSPIHAQLPPATCYEDQGYKGVANVLRWPSPTPDRDIAPYSTYTRGRLRLEELYRAPGAVRSHRRRGNLPARYRATHPSTPAGPNGVIS